MSDLFALNVDNLSKCYQIYDIPHDRLKQFIFPRLQRILGMRPRQYYREFWALKDVSFSVKKGETVGIVGKNGSGKSTLLQMICGTLNATQGTVNTSGKITALLELGSGFNPLFTGRENVYLSCSILGLTVDQVDRKFEEIEAFAEIGDFIDQPVKTYSSGMYVRLAFAVQVCVDPDILVIDEALAVGDAYFVHRCFHRLREMKARGKTIIFVSHDTGTVKNLCDRAIWIDAGRLQLSGEPDDVTRLYRANLFGVATKKQSPVLEASFMRGEEFSIETFKPERHIPNSDRRLGAQSCRLVGIKIYDRLTHRQIHEVKSGESFLLRMSFMNDLVMPGTPLVVGYAMRSPKGEEISAVNSHMEGVEVLAPMIGEFITVRTYITLPVMHRGNYALSVAISSGVDQEILDRVENAIVFPVTTSEEVIGLIRFTTQISVEQI